MKEEGGTADMVNGLESISSISRFSDRRISMLYDMLEVREESTAHKYILTSRSALKEY